MLKRSLHTSQAASTRCIYAYKDIPDFVRKGRKILGAALNYMDDVKAKNVEVPKKPVIFSKPTSSYIIEGQDIILPKVFKTIAHEVELGVVIGEKCKNTDACSAMKYVLGYCLALDLTAQCDLGVARKTGMPWCFGKGFDTATPVSKFLSVTEVHNPHLCKLWLTINGETKQCGNTEDLIFKVPELIEFISRYMTLEPYDLILTGTPSGAGQIKDGDCIECGLDKFVQMKFNVKSEC